MSAAVNVPRRNIEPYTRKLASSSPGAFLLWVSCTSSRACQPKDAKPWASKVPRQVSDSQEDSQVSRWRWTNMDNRGLPPLSTERHRMLVDDRRRAPRGL